MEVRVLFAEPNYASDTRCAAHKAAETRSLLSSNSAQSSHRRRVNKIRLVRLLVEVSRLSICSEGFETPTGHQVLNG
jgi:hypothetical protein